MSPLTEPTKFILKKDSVAATDTNIREVSLLLHGNQSGGQFVDSSLSPKTITKAGDVAPGSPGGGTPIYPSNNSAFGSAIAFDGTGDWLDVNSSADFGVGIGDFTIEAFVYPVQISSARGILQFGLGGSGPTFYLNSGIPHFWRGTLPLSSGAAALGLNAWHHVAISRSSGVLRFFVNGNLAPNVFTVTDDFGSAATARIGSTSFNEFFNGYIDDLRITKGVARYTSNFTPPTAPFPDF